MKNKQLVAFHDDQKIKAKYLKRLSVHRKAGAFVTNIWWDGHLKKGCAVGCTIHSGDLALYEKQLGIPEDVAWLEAAIHTKLLGDRINTWGEEVVEAVTPGHDLSLVGAHFVYWLLTSPSGPRGNCSSGDLDLLNRATSLYVRRINEDEPSKLDWANTRIIADDAVEVTKLFDEDMNVVLFAKHVLLAAFDVESVWEMLRYASRTFEESEKAAFWARMADRLIEILQLTERRKTCQLIFMKKPVTDYSEALDQMLRQ